MHTPDNITTLEPNEIFIFGSNQAGRHGGGAAKVAIDQFGAVYGVGEGLVGQSYAFPTLTFDYKKRPIDELAFSVSVLKSTAEALPSVRFYLTKVGCGIAGYDEDVMKALFVDMPVNVIKPVGWS